MKYESSVAADVDSPAVALMSVQTLANPGALFYGGIAVLVVAALVLVAVALASCYAQEQQRHRAPARLD